MLVEFAENGERRRVPESKAWRLRTDGEQEVVFSLLREGSSVLAYWSPNKLEYYETTVVERNDSSHSKI